MGEPKWRKAAEKIGRSIHVTAAIVFVLLFNACLFWMFFDWNRSVWEFVKSLFS